MRRIVLLIIIICSTLSLVACADLERQEIKTQFSFVFIYPDCPEDWKETSDGAEKCIEDFNNQNREITIDVQFSSADGAIEQSEILSRFLNIGIDGICIAMPSMQLIYPYDNDEQEKEATTKYNDYETAVFSLAELIKKGIDLDIPIITIGHDQYPFSTDPQSQD